MRASLALLLFLCCCGPSLPYRQVAPGEYHIPDTTEFDETVWAPKLCGQDVRYSYDKRRTSSYTEIGASARTDYATEGTLICDPEAMKKPDGK